MAEKMEAERLEEEARAAMEAEGENGENVEPLDVHDIPE